MKQFWDRVVPKIWTRLFLLVLMAILLTWVVVGIAFHWLGNARNVVSELGANQVPRLAHTSRLSAKAADLAILSNRILSVDQQASGDLEEVLRSSISELSTFISEGFDTALSQDDLNALQGQLASVIRNLNHTQLLEIRAQSKVEALRWLNVDMQDEAAAMNADFSYNIEVLTRALIHEEHSEKRLDMVNMLAEEQSLQRTFANLENETSLATTLATQVLTSQSLSQLAQFEDLMTDAIARINNRISELPDKAEYLSLEQATDALDRLTLGSDGLVQDRKDWHVARAQLSEHLGMAFMFLTDIQRKLQTQAELQRAELAETSEAFTENSAITMQLLLVTTALAAIGGLAITFLYIRPSIIQPMQSLTAAMRHIAAGDTPSLTDLPKRNDEFAQLAEAVETFQDSIRDRDRAIDELRQTQSELVQAGKMAALGNLSAGISHELNQPLGAIRQRLHLVERAIQADNKDKLRVQTGKIDDLVLRMERIISHLRRFARRSEYLRENVALSSAIRSALELLKAQTADHGIIAHIDPKLESQTVMGDAVLLEQVLVNLLSNACDAIAETGKPGEITIRSEDAADSHVVFSIVDTGVGLGDLKPERAVDPFVTTKDPGEGLGLGLSISYNIVTGMGGNLYLARRAEIGTRATVSLQSGET